MFRLKRRQIFNLVFVTITYPLICSTASAQNWWATATELKVVDKDKCLTSEGIEEMIEDDPPLSIKPNEQQRSALIDGGVDPDEHFRQKVIATCQEILGLPVTAIIPQPKKPEPGSYFGQGYIIEHSYASFGCSASWDKECDGDREFIAPAGRQACTISWDEDWEGQEADVEIKSINWFNGDEENPDRFRGYKISYYTQGSKNLIRQYKSKITIKNVKFVTIPAAFKNKARYEIGCDIPINKTSTNDIEIIDIPAG